jgi:modification methylase
MKYPDDFINKIIQGDCLDVMKGIPYQSIDLIITSPPYNMGNTSLGYQPLSTVGQKHYDKFDDSQDDTKYILWTTSIIKECLRISRYVFWNIQFVRSTRNSIFELQKVYKDNLKDIFIWHKQAVSNITAKNGGMAKGWEYVFMMGQDNLSTFNHNNFPKNGYVPNIQEWNQREPHPEHHALFPTAMPDYFIEYFTKPKDIVLDPFNGLGTTARSAKKLGRKYIGIEISDKYCEIAQRRLSQEYLFT